MGYQEITRSFLAGVCLEVREPMSESFLWPKHRQESMVAWMRVFVDGDGYGERGIGEGEIQEVE